VAEASPDPFSVVAADQVPNPYEGSDVPSEIRRVGAGSVARVAPATVRSHRNEGDEPVELWAISRRSEHNDATKVDDFWEASPEAIQRADVDRAEAG
jgi:hypothetical protein